MHLDHILTAGSFHLVWTDSTYLPVSDREFISFFCLQAASFSLCSLCSRSLISHFPPFDPRFSFRCHWATFTTHYDKFGVGISQHVSQLANISNATPAFSCIHAFHLASHLSSAPSLSPTLDNSFFFSTLSVPPL